MIREDIIGMLKVAMQKGKNLQQTTQSLYNSGYPRDEVDEAVRLLNTWTSNSSPAIQQIQQQKPKPVELPKEQLPKGQTQQIVSAYPSASVAPIVQQPVYYQPQPVYYQPQPQPYAQFIPAQQIVSNYEQKKFNVGKTITIVMVIMLMILIGILTVVIMFKPQLENFINNL